MNEEQPRGFLSLCLGEPFRAFFPLGLLIGISGVSLWPLYFTGIHKFYPGVMHGRMMIEGFMMAFVMGFLGTAFPRLTGAAPLSKTEFWILISLLLAVTGVHIGMKPLLGDCLFLALLVAFCAVLGRRVLQRSELPPPSFILVGAGFASAISGTSLLIASQWSPLAMKVAFLGNSLLYQAFILCLLLGVGGFLLPRFLGLHTPADEAQEETPEVWRRRAFLAGITAGLILITFSVEAWSGNLRHWGMLRALIATAYLMSQVPLYSGKIPSATVAQSLRLGFVLLIVGLFLPAIWPGQRVGALHLVFVGGYTIITVCVATRVILGHSGQGALVQHRIPFLTGTVVLLLLGGTLRVWGDFVPAWRPSMLNLASYAWMLAAALWGWRVLPRVRIPDSES